MHTAIREPNTANTQYIENFVCNIVFNIQILIRRLIRVVKKLIAG